MSLQLRPDAPKDTQSIETYPVNLMGYEVVLVDTPGFNDTYNSDGDILQSLVSWLASSYESGTKLSGIIYLHNINDVRVQGSAVRNLRVFRELCGEDYFENVTLCTTFWDVVEDEAIAEERVREMTSNQNFWGDMVARGSKVFTGPITRASAISIIWNLIERPASPLKVQREIVNERKRIEDTSAVSTLMHLEVERLNHEHEARLAEERRMFEEDSMRKERKFSQDLDAMRILHEEELAKLQEANKMLRAEIRSNSIDLSSPVEEIRHRKESIYSDTTPSADQYWDIDIPTPYRNQRFDKFTTFLTTTIRYLETCKWNGQVKCDFFGRKSCYLMVCVNCMKSIGGGECYSAYRHYAAAQRAY